MLAGIWSGAVDGWFASPAIRALAAALTAFLLSLLLGPAAISLLRRWQFLDAPEKGDSEHLDSIHAHKRTTPTMGGVLLVAAVSIAALLFGRLDGSTVPVAIVLLVALGSLGLVDDLIQVRYGKKGLRPRVKLSVQLAVASVLGVYLYLYPPAVGPEPAVESGRALFVPFFGGGSYLPLGIGYVFLVALVVTASSNAVNLTDGLDGLAAGCAGMIATAFVVLALAAGDPSISATLGVPYLSEASEAGVIAAALLGGSLGFLWFNCHPAKVFMGDTGALPLGGAVGLLAILLKQELLLVLLGGVLVVEALSVILQVFWFKTKGRRILLIAPLHHHYQFKGWSESKVTVRFWCAGAFLAGFTLVMLRLL